MKLIFATNNQHKVEEINSAIPSGIEVVSLKAAGIDIDIPEPHDTLRRMQQKKQERSSGLRAQTASARIQGWKCTASIMNQVFIAPGMQGKKKNLPGILKSSCQSWEAAPIEPPGSVQSSVSSSRERS